MKRIILGIIGMACFVGCQQTQPNGHRIDCTCDDCNLAPIELLHPIK